MPRRNHRTKRSVRSLRQIQSEVQSIRTLDTDELARRLVRRGLADPAVLGIPGLGSENYESGERR